MLLVLYYMFFTEIYDKLSLNYHEIPSLIQYTTMEMESVFGLPLEVISNLSDSSEHLAPDEPLNEKMVFVGGRYQGKYRKKSENSGHPKQLL